MNNLIILTSSFPYEGGEQFLETEIKYWKGTNFDNVYIMSDNNKGALRSFPGEIKLLKKHKINKKFLYVVKALLSVYFMKEVVCLFKRGGVINFISNLKVALKSVAVLLREKEMLSKTMMSNDIDGNNTFYCYWNDISFYAACILKEKGAVNQVVSRAHRFDLYEEQRKNKYMPLKRQFANSPDRVYLLSKSALKYYKRKYSVTVNNLDVARLGVNLPAEQPQAKISRDTVKVISISYCVPVKQIHLIASAVLEYAKQNQDIGVEWAHIGDGPLLKSLIKESRELTRKQTNLTINFFGHKKNTDVIEILKSGGFDIFINSSASEGIPVSIMEAMSCKIPSIAPNVGGISDLVNNENGYLMPKKCTASDIVLGINTICKNKKTIDYGNNAYNWVYERFNASINYPDFICKLEKIAGINEP